MIFAITIIVSFYLESQGFFYIMVFILKSNVLFLEQIYFVFSNEVEFRSMGFDFEHLRGNFGHQGVAFGSLGVDF